jgi:cyclic pyranopterin phosphate synthase
MLSHLDPKNRPQMVDVGGKKPTRRTARARAQVQLPEALARQFNGQELKIAKGPVFHTASVAGIMAAKRTSELIPLCHPLPLDHCQVTLDMSPNGLVIIDATASTEARTGVEMEALTAASVAALTVYDMCKSASPGIVIERLGLLEKTGGKNDIARASLADPMADPHI